MKIEMSLIMTSSFPPCFIDGEVWCGRGRYSDAQRALSSSLPNLSFIRIVAFDCPAPPLHNIAFEKRYKYLLRRLPLNHPFIIIAMRLMTKKASDIINIMDLIGLPVASNEESKREKESKEEEKGVKEGSEGIVLRRSKSLYVSGRASGSLVKIKAAEADSEALVISINNEGDVELLIPNKIQFRTLHSEVSVKEGDVVTFTYDGYSKREVPVNPIIQRIRKDVEWKDILFDYQKDRENIKGKDSEIGGNQKYPKIFWANTKNRKLFFNEFAKNKQFDPLLASNWYNVTSHDIRAMNGSRHVLSHYKKNFIKALFHVFPDIGLDITKFKHVPRGYWSESANRRALFDDFAKDNQFDPLIAENWYSVKANQVMADKNYGLLLYHKGSFPLALIDLYPNIGLTLSKFNVSPREFWGIKTNQRRALDDFAKINHFDPFDISNWYTIDSHLLLSHKDMHWIDQYYKGDIIKALSSTYPFLEFQKSKFIWLPKLHWTNRQNRKEFFDDIAKEYKIDPSAWNTLDHTLIMNRPHADNVLEYYQGDINNALTHLYSWNAEELFWKDKKNRRKVFETFAFSNKFDPLVAMNWYNISKLSLLEDKDTSKVLSFYQNDIYKSLKHLFPDVEFIRDSFDQEASWKSKSVQKKFFDSFATTYHFDSLVANNWYNVSSSTILSQQNANNVLKYYNGSFYKALETLYPNIGIDRTKFTEHQRAHWASVKNRKSFFDELARENHFDPLVASNWYKVSRPSVIAKNNSFYILEHYRGNYVKALEHIYPNIGLDSSKFSTASKGHWGVKSNRKSFFDDFANEHSFDPLILEHWTKKRHSILSQKNASSVLKYYNGDLMKALQDVYSINNM